MVQNRLFVNNYTYQYRSYINLSVRIVGVITLIEPARRGTLLLLEYELAAAFRAVAVGLQPPARRVAVSALDRDRRLILAVFVDAHKHVRYVHITLEDRVVLVSGAVIVMEMEVADMLSPHPDPVENVVRRLSLAVRVAYVETELQPRIIDLLDNLQKTCRLRIDHVLQIDMEILRAYLKEL